MKLGAAGSTLLNLVEDEAIQLFHQFPPASVSPVKSAPRAGSPRLLLTANDLKPRRMVALVQPFWSEPSRNPGAANN